MMRVMRPLYQGRRAVSIENDRIRVTVLEGGGHVAEILDKATGVNPLWTPPWPSIEPGDFDHATHPGYGSEPAESRLLSAIMGHNLCLDVFGGPSPEEAAAGLSAHGEGSVSIYQIEHDASSLVMRARFPLAELEVERQMSLHGAAARIREHVRNLTGIDRPVGWTQHVTLGPPFLERGVTEFRLPATRSKAFERAFGSADYLAAGAEFDWPMAPAIGGGHADLRRSSAAAASSAYTAHLMDPGQTHAYFVAYSARHRLAFGYVWNRSDFPWLGIWEENASRASSPWNGAGLTRGMEFGVSPFPETRREMIDRGRLFGVPTYRWIPARASVSVEYWAQIRPAAQIPETLEWPVRDATRATRDSTPGTS
jgi:hypothetical protein